jgi:tetratricopeptide (TPR) repeat protein
MLEENLSEFNNDNKILNAIRLHLVLLNVANEAVQFKLTELIKQQDASNPGAVKKFLEKYYQPRHYPKYLEGFMKTLKLKFIDKILDFPNDLKEFDMTACYSIARNFLNLSDIRPFDELREIRNKYYGHLNLLEIEDTDYTHILGRLKKIIGDFTQNEPLKNQALRDRIKKIESIQALSSLSLADMSNLKETILDLISKNRDMFSKIGTHFDAFIKTSRQFHADKIDEIRQLSSELKKWSESIKSQNISQEDLDKIGEVVSVHLNLRLNFEETLKPYFEDVKSHVSTMKNEIIAHFESGVAFGNDSNTLRLVQDLMQRVVPFIGRTQTLDKISEEMKTKQIVVLAAYGGTGKSTLANEFGYRYAEKRDNNDERVSILVHCETRDKVYDDLKKIALLLKIDISNKEIAEKLSFYVRAKLTELDQSFLFILDNVEKYEDIDVFLKEFSQLKSDKCKFLMTTRDKYILEKKDFENYQKCTLTIDSFNLEEANEFVHKYLDKMKHLSGSERENLISVVKYEHKILPLKLKLIVNYINDNLVDYECLNDCVEFIRTQSSGIKEVEIESNLFKSLSKTKSLSILAYSAYLDADTISLNLMRGLFKPLKEALNKLISLGMLDVDYDKSKLTMHRLVQAEMRSFIQNNPNELLEDSKDEWTILNNIIKHLNSSLTIVDRSVTNNGTKLSEKIDQDYAQVKAIVNFIDQKSKEESGLSKNLKEQFRLNVDFLKLKEKLGDYYIYFDVSNAFKALDLFMFVKNSFVQVKNNNDNEDLARSLNNLGRIYDYLSKYEEGIKYKTESYEMRQRLYNNKDHADLALSLNNIGVSYSKLGKYEESLKYDILSYEMRQRLYNNKDHADLALSLNNIGVSYSKLGKYEESLKYDILSYEMRQRLYNNKDHAYLAESLNNIGASYDSLGKYEQSLKWFNESYKMRQRLYNNKDHADLAQSANNIGASYDKLGKYEESLKWYNNSYEMRQRLYNNKDHADLAQSLNNIGSSYSKLGKYEESLKWYNESYEMFKRLYNNKDHADLASSLNSIGVSYDKLGKYEESLKYDILSYEMRQRLYNKKDHADLASSLNNIGASYDRLGKYEESLKWKKESYEMRQRLYNNKDHAHLATSLNSIGVSYSKLGKYEESKIYFNLSNEMKQRLLF